MVAALWSHLPRALGATPDLSVTPTPTPIEYVLPFPGILPTHPLYFLKTLRDRIIELLISDHTNKADFYILQADKKLGFAMALSALGKTKEANKAYADALSHRTQAVGELEARKREGGAIPGHLVEKLTRSLTKHREVLRKESADDAPLEALFTRVDTLLIVSQ